MTEHAKKRIRERKISEKFIKEVLENPTKIHRDSKNKDRVLFKKLYLKRGLRKLLLVIGEVEKDKLKIITIIDTSKISKYL